MDHLILPQNPRRPPINVPALSLTGYDGGVYATYPDRQGWGSRPVAEWQEIFEHPTPELTAFLQRWLYYGLAYIIFGKVNIPDMTVVNDQDCFGHPLIRTGFLKLAVEQVLTQRQRASLVFEAVKVCGDVLYSLQETRGSERKSKSALAECESLLMFIKLERPKSPLNHDICISISLLWELAISLQGYTEQDSRKGALYSKSPVLPEYPLRCLIREAGWCPWEETHLIQGLTVSGVIFMVNLERPRPSEDHSDAEFDRRQQPLASDSCTPVFCRHRNLRQDTYKTSHADECPGCQDVVADLETLEDVLLADSIPVISAAAQGGDSTRLSIKPSDSTPYIGISHVWSDGLGNLQRCALPQCQFHRICSLARSLPLENSQSCHIWIDTLCVPPDSVGSDRAQKAALGKMRKAYKSATAVLVLDAWLASCKSSKLSQSEILMRIFHSAWNRRLWTYQEGVLAQLLFFQFRDRVVEIDSFYREFCETHDLMVGLTLRRSLDTKYWSLRYLRKESMGRANTLRHIIPELSLRTTSVSEDEALCLASLLNLDMAKILQSPPEARMEALWGMVDELPVDILLQSCVKLSRKGLRWAPTSLLVAASNFNHLGRYSPVSVQNVAEIPLARNTPEGLRFQQRGIVFNVGRGRLGKAFMLKDNKGVHHYFHVHFRDDREHSHYGTCVTNGEYQCIPIIDLLGVYGTPKVAFISMAAATAVVYPTYVGIIAAILYEKEGIFYGRKITTALKETQSSSSTVGDTNILDKCYPQPENIRDFQGIPLLKGEDFIVHGVAGTAKPVTQTWCIE